MAGLTKHCTFCGSLLLGAATGLTAFSEDSVVPRRGTSVVGQTEVDIPPAPGSDPMAVPFDDTRGPINTQSNSVSPIQYAVQDCPPSQPGFFTRIKRHCQAKYWGYPEEFYGPPLGAAVNGSQMTQVAKGQAARMALYQYDFLPDSDQLNTRGKAELCRIAQWLPANNFPVFVESTPGNLELDELRRQTVLNEIGSICFAIPSERVIVGRPNIRGLNAAESLLIDRNRLSLIGRGAAGGGGGTSGTSNSSNATQAR